MTDASVSCKSGSAIRTDKDSSEKSNCAEANPSTNKHDSDTLPAFGKESVLQMNNDGEKGPSLSGDIKRNQNRQL